MYSNGCGGWRSPTVKSGSTTSPSRCGRPETRLMSTSLEERYWQSWLQVLDLEFLSGWPARKKADLRAFVGVPQRLEPRTSASTATQDGLWRGFAWFEREVPVRPPPPISSYGTIELARVQVANRRDPVDNHPRGAARLGPNRPQHPTSQHHGRVSASTHQAHATSS